MIARQLISLPSTATTVVSRRLSERRRDVIGACTEAPCHPCDGARWKEDAWGAMDGFWRLRPKTCSLELRWKRQRLPPREEIRYGSAAGASPRNGYGSGRKTSREDANTDLFACASCVCSRFVTGNMSSTTRRKWRYCTERVDDLSTAIPLTDIVVGCACGPAGILPFQARQRPQPEQGRTVGQGIPASRPGALLRR